MSHEPAEDYIPVPPTLKLFTVTDHNTHYPVGGASIVLAHSREEAIVLLDEQLEKNGLQGYTGQPYSLHEVPLTAPFALVLRNGDY